MYHSVAFEASCYTWQRPRYDEHSGWTGVHFYQFLARKEEVSGETFLHALSCILYLHGDHSLSIVSDRFGFQGTLACGGFVFVGSRDRGFGAQKTREIK